MLPFLHKRLFIFVCLSFLALLVLSSCTAPKSVAYFQNLNRDTSLTNLVTKDFESKIRKGDLLYIGVTSITPEFVNYNAPLNSTMAGGAASVAGPPTNGYIVDDFGNIELYKLGKVHADGSTKTELKNYLQKELQPYLKDPIVSVRFLNHRVTVLGEVAKPQIVIMPHENMTVLEALGLSGDILLTGRRDNVLVIRDLGQDKTFKRINLTDNSVFSSSYYYIKPDDIIYVEPTRARMKAANQNPQTQQVVSYILSGISVVVIVLTQLFK